MKSMGRTWVVSACVIAMGATAIIWHLFSVRANERRLAEQAKHYRQLADQGDANAEFELGTRYLWGRGVPQDYAQADYWYQKAADQGLAKAKYAIGNLYYYGRGLTQNYAEALVWYRKAADQGDAAGQYAMGLMYYYGRGVPQNYSEAMAWYLKAARQSYARAESGIGYLCWNGLGVARDREEADKWYRRAADHGDEDAQRWLGLRFSPMRPSTWVIQTALAAGCLFLMSGFCAPKRLLQDSDARRVAVGGVLGFLNIAMYLFGHSEYCLFPSAWLATAFRISNLFLGGIVITLLVTGLKPRAGRVLLFSSGILLVGWTSAFARSHASTCISSPRASRVSLQSTRARLGSRFRLRFTCGEVRRNPKSERPRLRLGTAGLRARFRIAVGLPLCSSARSKARTTRA